MLEATDIHKTSGRFHYGWWIVFGAFLSQSILMICLMGLPLSLSQIEKTLNVSHASVGAISSVFGACYSLFAVFWGHMADKYGPRKIITLAGVIAGFSLFIFGTHADSLLRAIIIYACTGFGAAGLFSATVPKLIGAWFSSNKRGRATSLVTPGGAACGAVLGLTLPPLSLKYGWQDSFVILSVIVFILVIIISSLIRNNPAEKGLTPLGTSGNTEIEVSVEQKATLADFIAVGKQKVTWHLSTMFICWQFPYMISTSFTALSLVAAGLSVAQSGVGIAIYKICSVCGQQIWGPLSDKIERKYVIAMGTFGWLLSALFFSAIWSRGTLIMYIAVGCLGFCIGCIPVILASFSDYYAPQYRGTASGLITTTGFIGSFTGPLLAGIVADAYGMTAAYKLGAAVMFCCVMIALTLPKLRTTNPKVKMAA